MQIITSLVYDLLISPFFHAQETDVANESIEEVRVLESFIPDEKRDTSEISNIIDAEDISVAGDSDAADALKRITGLSLVKGKYVYVRGLGDRYTKSILNGVDIPGLDPDRNTIQMDIFPTNILENIIVIKSAAAEYPADFTGGVVDIVTKDFPTKKESSFSLGTSYNSEMHFKNDYLNGPNENTDFIGFDSGSRDIPISRFQYIPGTFDNDIDKSFSILLSFL
mgnify:CR=1 FL=1